MNTHKENTFKENTLKNINTLQLILMLQKLSNTQQCIDKSHGICMLVTLAEYALENPSSNYFLNPDKDLTYTWKFKIKKYFSSWKYYSGNAEFPVPSTWKKTSPRTFFHKKVNLWEGKQLGYRLSLCNHLITQLRKDLL